MRRNRSAVTLAPKEALEGNSAQQAVADAHADEPTSVSGVLASSIVSNTQALRRGLYILAAIPPALLLLFHAARYYPFIADDSLISLRYARRLVDGQGLTWTDGERVEGFSNLTWVLGTALLHLLGVDPIAASRILGGLGMIGALSCVVVWERRRGDFGFVSGSAAATAVALGGPLAVWAIGGLEQAFVALFLGASIAACREHLDGRRPHAARIASCSLALLCLTRPDGLLLAGAILGAYVFAGRLTIASVKRGVRLGLPAAFAVLGQLAFRLVYYRDWIPNTARAKVAFTYERLEMGRDYLLSGADYLWPLLLVAVVSTLLGWTAKRSLLLVLLPLVAWTAYVVFIGGDIFPGRRHLVPIVLLLAFIIASGLCNALSRPRNFVACCVVCVVSFGYQVKLTWSDPENQRAIDERWEWDGKVVGLLLKAAFAKQAPLLAVDAAGTLPYFSRLPALDMLGLNDRFLAHNPPADLGKGFVGHELGNGDYVYARRPDLVIFCQPGGRAHGCFRSGVELVAKPEFHRDYVSVRFEGRKPYPFGSLIWVRKEGRVGFQRSDREVRIPGFLVAAHRGVAALDGQGRIGAELPPMTDVTLQLPGECAGCRVSMDADPGATAELASPGSVRVRTDRPTHVRSIVLER